MCLSSTRKRALPVFGHLCRLSLFSRQCVKVLYAQCRQTNVGVLDTLNAQDHASHALALPRMVSTAADLPDTQRQLLATCVASCEAKKRLLSQVSCTEVKVGHYTGGVAGSHYCTASMLLIQGIGALFWSLIRVLE